MSDPFEEYEQVGTETNVFVNSLPSDIQQTVSSYLPSIEVHQPAPSHSAVPPEFASHPTFAKDFEKRKKFEFEVNNKVQEIHAAMERLYFVRHDPNRPKEQAIVDSKALLSELNRLNEELAQLRDKQMKVFSDSLQLEEVGITRRLSTKSFRSPTSTSPTSSFTSSSSSSSSAPRTGSSVNLGRGVMRSKSTQAGLEGNTGSDKWWSLFSLFREQRKQDAVSQAQAIVDSKPSQALLDEEINKLRAAVYSLQQVKQRTPQEEQCLKIFQAKLKALHTI